MNAVLAAFCLWVAEFERTRPLFPLFLIGFVASCGIDFFFDLTDVSLTPASLTEESRGVCPRFAALLNVADVGAFDDSAFLDLAREDALAFATLRLEVFLGRAGLRFSGSDPATNEIADGRFASASAFAEC